ncbi:MAG: hypothetical protein ACON49_00965 [Candidatus Puniceispirillaceae bacterium]
MNHIKRIGRFIILGFVMTGLMACQSGVSLEKVTTIDVDKAEGLAINARRLEVVNNWLMPLEAPYVEHELNPTPATSVIEWAKKTVVPKGSSGELILNISEASVQQEELAPAEGLLNSLKDNQETRIRVTIKAQLLWIQPVGDYTGTAELAAKTTQTLPESATPADYLIAKQNLVNRAIALIDQQARAEIMKIDAILLP